MEGLYCQYDVPGTHVELEEVAKVVYAMCSGLMDGIRGQTLTPIKVILYRRLFIPV